MNKFYEANHPLNYLFLNSFTGQTVQKNIIDVYTYIDFIKNFDSVGQDVDKITGQQEISTRSNDLI